MKKRRNNKFSSANKNKLRNFAFSSLVTVLIYILLTLIAAFACYKADISKDKYYLIMLVISCVSSIIGGFRTTRLNKEKGLISGILGALPILLMTLIFALLFNNGILGITILIPLLITLVSGAVSGAVAINLRR